MFNVARCFYLRLGSGGVIEEKGSTDQEAFAHLQNVAGDGLVEVDARIHEQAELGGKFTRSTKRLTPAPAEALPPGITIVK